VVRLGVVKRDCAARNAEQREKKERESDRVRWGGGEGDRKKEKPQRGREKVQRQQAITMRRQATHKECIVKHGSGLATKKYGTR